jgi:uncharacterized protein
MTQSGQRLQLVLLPFDADRALRDIDHRAEDLDRDIAAEQLVMGAEHLGHPAGPDPVGDAIPTGYQPAGRGVRFLRHHSVVLPIRPRALPRSVRFVTVPELPELQLTDWRRRVAQMYATVRAEPDPRTAHALWRAERDELFRSHPQSPLATDDPMQESGLPYWPYDASLRFEVPLVPPDEPAELAIESVQDGTIRMRLVGRVSLPGLDVTLDVWKLAQYAGGLFVPVRDGTAGTESYGGGRYLLDTAKGADLGGTFAGLIVDLNFLYHPSCRYDPEWQCPLAPPGNRLTAPVEAGERL